MIDPASPQPKESFASRSRGRRLVMALGFCMLSAACVAGLLLAQHWRHERMQVLLLSLDINDILRNSSLTAFAKDEAKPRYAANCARCHGADLKGNAALGAPNLIDRHWLFGDGGVFDIERTVLYGIRSGHSKSHNVTDMPAFGLTGRLSAAETRNLVQYLLQLKGRPHQPMAASEGRALYYDVGKANCGDCHGEDGRGNSNYGAPDLTATAASDVAEARGLYDAIYSGQHRIMPAWIDVLSLEQIRALAIYVYLAGYDRE
jgi:cytochrome c oxidase cbb3-type subunit III